jgi:hypothetical protein
LDQEFVQVSKGLSKFYTNPVIFSLNLVHWNTLANCS